MPSHSSAGDDVATTSRPEWLTIWSELFLANLEEYAVFALDLSGTILTWQPGVKQVLGYDPEAFVGQPGHVMFTDGDRQMGAPERETHTALERGQVMNERWHVRADGSRFWGSGMMIALLDASGEPVGLAKIVRDRTAQWLKGETQGLRALQLEGDIAARNAQIQALATDLTLAEQRERQRISQLLHDELQQQLFALQMMVKGLLGQAAALETPLFVNELNEVYSLTKTSLATTRTLVSELSPAALLEGDLEKALVWLTEHMQARHALKVTLVSTEGIIPKLPNALGVLLFQCVQELLFNVVKHAQAEHAVVTLRRYPDGLQLEVKDDGRGFVMLPTEPNAPRQEVFGLQSVQQRLKAFGGVLQIDSVPGNGTRVTIAVPLS